MTPPRVWAPAARAVELAAGGRREAMAAEPDGWWAAARSLPPATDYRFVLDGGDPLPDPRSPWQPEGVDGPSRTVDHASFPWSDRRFQAPPLASALVYELHIGTFCREGTFDGAIAHLDHLAELGVTHLELMPVGEFPGRRNWGYDGVFPFAPHHAYGGPDGLKRLIDAAHARGLAVVIDVVYNHVGPEGSVLHRFGPYFTDRHQTPWGSAINFDGEESDEVRRFVLDNALMWLRDYHADALRLDAVHAIVDTSALHILEELASEVEALAAATARHLQVIAESDLNDPRIVRPREAGGYGLDAQWSDDFHHALHTLLTGERASYYQDFGSLADLAQALTRAFVYDGRRSRHRRRRHGRPAAGLPGDRFLGYLQNHDQVGNRARGERMSALVPTARLKVGAALVLLAPFVPMLFMGEEWGASTPFPYFTDHRGEELARAVREGRRREYAGIGAGGEVPDPQSEATFRAARLDWSELEREPHASLLDWHRRLVALRRAEPDLASGDLAAVRVHFDEEARTLAITRGQVVVAANLGSARARVLHDGPAGLAVRLASEPGVALGGAAVELPPDSVAALAPPPAG